MSSNKDLTPAERQLRIRNIVVEHDRFLETIETLEEFHYPVKGGVHAVGSVSALIGDSRTGKSFAARKYAKRFPVQTGEAGLLMPVVSVDMPMEGGGGARAILEAIASALRVPFSLRITNPALREMILTALVDRRVELLLLDEFEQVFRDNDRRLVGFGRGLIRKILDLGTLSVVCIGLPATYRIMRDDPQLLGRGGLPYRVLRPYNWDSEEERRAFRLLCREFDKHLPFEESSNLSSHDIAGRLFYATQGNIGLLKIMLESAGAIAINTEALRIELEHFAEAYERRRPPGSSSSNPFRDDFPKTQPKPFDGEAKVKRGNAAHKFSKKRDSGKPEEDFRDYL